MMNMINAMKLKVFSALLPALLVSGYAQESYAAQTIQELPVLQVRVGLSPKARKTLAQGHEGIIVSASWNGTPVPQKQDAADEIGAIDLGTADITLPTYDSLAQFPPSSLKTERLSWIKGSVHVNVNVFSARRHWPDNILSCDVIDGVLTKVGHHVITLNCSLISEQRSLRVVDH